MFRCFEARLRRAALAAVLAMVAAPGFAQTQTQDQTQTRTQSQGQTQAQGHSPAPWAGIGRPATPAEIRAWDIDVRPDFRGLPPGSGSAARGMDIWESKCMSCHGVFGESNEVFTPIVGGTDDDDIRTGRVANLRRSDYPQRTTLMKLSQISTLWDYINRAMPWTAPKSLTVDEVYAVTAYILNLGEIVPDDFVLSDKNMAEVQKRLPNRNGMVFYEPLWRVDGKGDVHNVVCMENCETEIDIRSFLPEFARDSHGNLLEQNRPVGPVRGQDTTQPPLTDPLRLSQAAAPAAATAPAAPGDAKALALATQSACMACHGVANKIVGPGLREIAQRYAGDAEAEAKLVQKVKNGGQGSWGPIAMPPQAHLGEADIRALVRWILGGAR